MLTEAKQGELSKNKGQHLEGANLKLHSILWELLSNPGDPSYVFL